LGVSDGLKSRGAKYSKAAEKFGAHVVVSGRLLTGQNPASAAPLGEALVKALKQ
jgi:putative intracellular protease/amidase